MTEPPLLTRATLAVLRALTTGPATAFDLCQAHPLTGGTVRRALDRIVTEGWATVAETRGGSWGPRRTYTITQAGRDIARQLGNTTEAS